MTCACLIQVSSLRSPRQAHARTANKRKRKIQSRAVAESPAEPLGRTSAITLGGFWDRFRFWTFVGAPPGEIVSSRVYKLDRFSRDKYATATHKKTLKDNGVNLIFATEHIPDTPEGIIFESMLEGYAEYYSAELSQKVRRGMNETRQKGNFTGGFLIYGYKIENKKVVIDEETAEVCATYSSSIRLVCT